MNPFDDFDLDMVKITNAKRGLRSCDGSSGGPISSILCSDSCNTCSCPNTSAVTMCISQCKSCSEDPKCQTLEGRCE